MKSALIIDDCIDLQDILSLMLFDRDFAVWTASSVEEAYETLKNDSFDIIFCDLHLPFTLGKEADDYLYSEEVGIRTIEELRWVYPELPIVAMSAAPKIDLMKLQQRLGPVPSLEKPFSKEVLDLSLQSYFHSYSGMSPESWV